MMLSLKVQVKERRGGITKETQYNDKCASFSLFVWFGD
jgi:hypothetical protein